MRGSAGGDQEAKVAYGGIQELAEMRTDGRSRLRQEGSGLLLDDTLDRWLGRSLHERFDAAITEPLPEEWMSLIEEATRGS